jgi:Carboxypeptidase regulatory-like domain
VVVATSASTNVGRTTTGDSKGFYNFPALNGDVYNVTISKPGFRDFAEDGIRTRANSALCIDVKLDGDPRIMQIALKLLF